MPLLSKNQPNYKTAEEMSGQDTVVASLTNFKRTRKGFTLVEILVVLGIIAALLGVGVTAIKSVATSKGVNTAVPLVESIFDQARQVARSSGTPTRVVIYSDASGTKEEIRTRFHRMIGVATGRDSSGEPVQDISEVDEWRLVSRPVIMPSGAFYNDRLSVNSGTDDCIFPGDNSAKSCFVYEFNSEGALILADGSGASIEDGSLVVQAGKLIPTSTPELRPSRGALRDIGGVRIYSSGRTASYESPNQIISAGETPTFN